MLKQIRTQSFLKDLMMKGLANHCYNVSLILTVSIKSNYGDDKTTEMMRCLIACFISLFLKLYIKGFSI